MMTNSLDELRRRARRLLDIGAPQDGLAAYYALHHDPEKTQLLVEGDSPGQEGFMAVCQTGQDLFRQLAVLRARQTKAAVSLLRRGLYAGRPYSILTTLDLQPALEQVLQLEHVETHRIYHLDLARYEPLINVLVVSTQTAAGLPRFVIRSQQDAVAAEAGINWRSPHFAEVYVFTAPQARGRGWGKAVMGACIGWVLGSGVRPLYVVSEGNEPSIRLAESVGFVDVGARELAVEGGIKE